MVHASVVEEDTDKNTADSEKKSILYTFYVFVTLNQI